MNVIFKRIGELSSFGSNSRTHSDAQVEQIRGSICEFGWTKPVVVDGNTILAGHGAVMAAKAAYADGAILKTLAGETIPSGCVPCIQVDGWADVKKSAYVIADNKIPLGADWDVDILKSELEEIQNLGYDATLTGFTVAEIAELFSGQGECPVDNQDGDESSTCKPGDTWILGNHKLVCGQGDCLDADACVRKWQSVSGLKAYREDDGTNFDAAKV